MERTSVIELRPIGVIRTPFRESGGTPIQPAFASGAEGTVEVYEEFVPGLKDLEGFSHVHLLYHFHRVESTHLRGKPFLDDEERGVFAMRSPRRPNPIGLSVVRLLGIDGPVLHVKDVDMVDGTPLLDIKPYVPRFDARPDASSGWLTGEVLARRELYLARAREEGDGALTPEMARQV